MSGSIFVLNTNNSFNEMKESSFDTEDILQALIEKHPSILAGEQINPENPCKWIFISREMGVPSQQDGRSQWFLDHLFIDQDAMPTLVEVKRSTDTRVRREVVAQMLDYAANASAFWPIDDIRRFFEMQLASGNTPDLASLGVDEDKEEFFWQSVCSNLKAGRIRLLFVSDDIPMSLQRIIEFLNTQMADTEVLGLEIKQYISGNGMKTFVPKIVGRTASTISVKGYERRLWDETDFLEQVRALSGEAAEELCKTLLRKSEELGCRLWWGKGSKHASALPVYDTKNNWHSFFSVYPYQKNTFVEMQLHHLKPPFNTPEMKETIKKKLEQIDGIVIPSDRMDKRPSFRWNLLSSSESLRQFLEIFEWYISEVKRLDN